MAADTKTCTRCGETKPLETGFRYRANPTQGRPHWKSECRDCHNAWKRARTARDRAAVGPGKPPLPTRAEMLAWYLAGCHVA